jgi:cell division protein FtsI (penicillin-binding protein 3)
MARRQFHAKSLIRPRRGSITDRNNEPLAVNLETNSLAANPAKIKNKRGLAKLLARATDQPYSKLFQKLSEKREFTWIKRHLTDVELRRFKKWRLIDADGDLVDGLWLVKESDRIYPHGQLASHIVGTVNIDSEGLEGIELWKNEHLRGKVVSVSAIKDALGRPTFIDAVAAKNIQDGEPIALSIDASLQFEVEQHLANAVRRTSSRSGIVIVMNADSGEILALANEPTFSPNEKSVPGERRRNRALTDGYEPGSTLKAVLVASALSHGAKLSDQVFGEKGSFEVSGHRITEAEAHEKFEWISMKKMIQVSSNVAAAKIALKLGADKYLKTLQTFGFGEKSGMGFPGEISGKIPPKREWRPLTLANVGFGQGILVTPLQMIRAYAAFLNGGFLVRPTLLKKTEFSDKSIHSGAKEKDLLPIRILTQKASQDVVEALSTVTEEGGTGKKAGLPGYQVAGKTGTSQMVDPNTGRYSREKYVASFIGFAVGIEPRVVIFTSLIEPKGGYYAATTAAPLFRDVLGSVANRVGLPIQSLPPSKLAAHSQKGLMTVADTEEIHYTQAAQVIAEDIKLQRSVEGNGTARGWVMPSLKGLSSREVFRILKGHKFHLAVHGAGIVFHQFPEAGKGVAEGDTIRLILSEP